MSKYTDQIKALIERQRQPAGGVDPTQTDAEAVADFVRAMEAAEGHEEAAKYADAFAKLTGERPNEKPPAHANDVAEEAKIKAFGSAEDGPAPESVEKVLHKASEALRDQKVKEGKPVEKKGNRKT